MYFDMELRKAREEGKREGALRINKVVTRNLLKMGWTGEKIAEAIE